MERKVKEKVIVRKDFFFPSFHDITVLSLPAKIISTGQKTDMKDHSVHIAGFLDFNSQESRSCTARILKSV